MNETILLQLGAIGRVFEVNTAGISHPQSLVQPRPGGNCMNWVVGHLVVTYNTFLGARGVEPAWSTEEGAVYARASEALTDPAAAKDFAALCAAFQTTHGRIVELVAGMSAADLAAAAPYSPRNADDETVGSLLALLAFHQAYHVGQIGLLRRLAGEAGAIR